MLGKRLLRGHIGVRRMVWQERPRQEKKTGHLEDRTLSDVVEVKNFDWGSKGRVTSQKNVSPPKNLTQGRVQRITIKKAVVAVFQVTKW